jgi:N-acetylated-alpha-linked acidic dipeptidase
MMRQSIALLSLFALTANAAETVYPLRGYTAASSAKEVQWEEKFRQIPDTANLREYMRRLSARPHHVGSPYDKTNAEWILAQLKSYGLDAQIETFDALFPTPQQRSLQLLGSSPFTAKLEEPTLAVDPTSGQKSEQLGYSRCVASRYESIAPRRALGEGAGQFVCRLLIGTL